MKRKNILFVSFLVVFLMLSTPMISAIRHDNFEDTLKTETNNIKDEKNHAEQSIEKTSMTFVQDSMEALENFTRFISVELLNLLMNITKLLRNICRGIKWFCWIFSPGSGLGQIFGMLQNFFATIYMILWIISEYFSKYLIDTFFSL